MEDGTRAPLFHDRGILVMMGVEGPAGSYLSRALIEHPDQCGVLIG